MNIRYTSVALLVACSIGVGVPPSFANRDGSGEVLASVTKVVHPDHCTADTVTLRMTIHSPSRFGGFQFLVATESTERAEIRQQFPDGSLYRLELPAKISEELEAQVEARAAVEETLDTGIDPRMISQFFILPHLALSDLATKPIAAPMVRQ